MIEPKTISEHAIQIVLLGAERPRTISSIVDSNGIK